jgi:hypothetical protein
MEQRFDKPQICYLLGAGASFEALPLISEVPYDLGTFKQYIINYNKSLGDAGEGDLESKLSNFQNIINQTLQHHSIDTLARKYWLKQKSLAKQENNGEYDWYQLIKNIITCWLTWRRLNNLDIKFLEYDADSKKSERLKKLISLDPRYDAFFSAILDENLELPNNIKIVSWNYDLQIEQSFKFYLNDVTLKEVGHSIGINYNKYSIGPIIKLNGSAVIAEGTKALWESSYNHQVHEVFIKSLSNQFSKNIYSNIRFAWEEEGMIDDYRRLASKYVSESDIVVVIGYSFPIFNRETDRQLFANFTEKGISKIYIQADEKDAEGIKSQLESIETGLSKKAEIIQNLNQFFIPNEYWSNPDPLGKINSYII